MRELVEALFILVAALTIMLFFGPVIVILSIIGRLEIGSIKIDLSSAKPSGRIIVGIIGMIVWLAVYIPLILLASKSLILPSSLPAIPVNLTPTPTIMAMPATLSVPTSVFEVSPTPLSPLAGLVGTYTGTFFTNSTRFFGTYTVTLIILEDGTGRLIVPGAPYYEDNNLNIRLIDDKTVLVIFNDKEGDPIEARLIKDNGQLRGVWRYATGNPQHTATGEIVVKKVE